MQLTNLENRWKEHKPSVDHTHLYLIYPMSYQILNDEKTKDHDNL